MLDVLVALALREPHVLGGHVVLQIDEGLARAAYLPQRAQRRAARDPRAAGAAAASGSVRPSCCGDARGGALAVLRGGGESEHAARGARRARRAPRVSSAREGREILAPARRGAQLGRERGERASSRPDMSRLSAASVRRPPPVERARATPRTPWRPRDRCDRGACVHLDAERAGALGGRSEAARTSIDARAADAGGVQGEGGLVGLVVVREERRPAPDRDAVATQVRERRAGEHDAGDVVAGEGDEPLGRPGGDAARAARGSRAAARASPPQRVPPRRREGLQRAEDAVTVGAEHGGRA